MTQRSTRETHNQVASVGSIKGGPSALHFGSPRRVHRCEYMQKVFGKTLEYGRVGFSGVVIYWLSAGGQTQYPSGCAKGLVECWSLLSGSPVEVGKCGRKTSTVVSDDTA